MAYKNTSRIRIGVDAGALAISDERLKVGVWRVTFELLKALTKLDAGNEYQLFSFTPLGSDVVSELGKNAKNIVVRPAKGWMRVALPSYLALHPVDVFLGMSQALPFFGTSHNIGFIYDLGFLFNPTSYGASYDSLVSQTEHVVGKSRAIITISEFSKRDIIHEYKRDPDTIHVCYPGVGGEFTPVGGTYSHPHSYFLYVGSLNKAKDIPSLLRAFSHFRSTSNKHVDLLLAGGDYWPDEEIESAMQKLNLGESVKMLGHVPDNLIPKLYRGAVAFVTTSRREGFCLPAAESMACGTPVISYDRGAMKEVVRDGGIIVSGQPEALASAMLEISAHTKKRTSLSQKAHKTAKKYSWETMASAVSVVIGHIHENH